jgi:multidrug efflux system membrane fusion protein
MKASRITALGLVAAATLWILSGHLLPRETGESSAAIRSNESEAKKLFRVGVTDTSVVPHSRKLVLSGHTEADRRVTLTARTGGLLTELRVRRGTIVKANDVIAVLSDERSAPIRSSIWSICRPSSMPPRGRWRPPRPSSIAA